MGTHVRVYDRAKVLRGILPDYKELSHQSVLNEPGVLSMSYPVDGADAWAVDEPGGFLAISEDGAVQPDWYILEDDTQSPTEGPGQPFQLTCRGYMAVLDDALVLPATTLTLGSMTNFYPSHKFSNVTPGYWMRILLQKAKGRGCFPELTWNFTDTHDSAGTPWPAKYSPIYECSGSLLGVLNSMVENKYVETNTAGFALQMFVPNSAAGLARDKKNIVFAKGKDALSFTKGRSRRNIKNAIVSFGNEKSMYYIESADSINTFGRKEGAASDGRMTSSRALRLLAERTLGENSTAKEQVSLQVWTGENAVVVDEVVYKPGVDFRCGDFIRYDDRRVDNDTLNEMRVRSITIQRESADSAATATIDFIDDAIRWRKGTARRLSSIVGGNLAIAPGGSAFKSVDDFTAPAPPSGTVVTGTKVVPAGSGHATTTVIEWAEPVENIDGTGLERSVTYQWQWRYYPLGDWSPLYEEPGPAVSIAHLVPARELEVRVRTVKKVTPPAYSDWVVTGPIVIPKDNVAPPATSAPIVSSRLGVVSAGWNGRSATGEAMPADFDVVQVHVSTNPGFVPSTATRVGAVRTDGDAVVIPGLPYNVAQTVKFVAFDTSGNASPASVGTTHTVKPLVDTDLIGQILNGANFMAGTINTEALANGSVIASKIANLTSAPLVNGVALENVTSAQEKANLAQAAAIAASLPKVDASGGATILRNPLKGYWTGTPASIGDHIVIRTTLPASSNYMVKFSFTGSSLSFGSIDGWASVYLYNNAGANTLFQPKISTNGELPVIGRMAKDPSGNLVVIISAAVADGWDYLRFSLDEVQIGNGAAVSEARRTGWTITSTNDVSEFNSTIVTCEARDLMDTHTLAQGWRKAGTVQIDGGMLYADSVTATQIAANAITVNELAANAVEAANIKAGAVIAGKIAVDAIVANNLAANSVVAGKIAANAVTAATIAADAITSTKIAAEAIGTRELAANSVVAGKIAANAVTAATIAALAVTAGKIAANAVTAEKIQAGAINADHISLGVLRTNLIADASFEDEYAFTIFDPFGSKTGTAQVGNTAQWRVEPANLAGESVTRINDGARSGRYAVALTSPGGSTGDPSIVSPVFPIVAGKSYRISVHAHSRTAQASMVVTCMTGSTPSAPNPFSNLAMEGDTGWTFPALGTSPFDYTSYEPQTWVLSVPADHPNPWAALRITNYVPTGACTLVIDDVSAVEIGVGGASELGPAGLRLFDSDGYEVGAFVSNRPNYFSVSSNGETTASITPEGGITARGLDVSGVDADGDGSADTGITLYGTEFRDWMMIPAQGIKFRGNRSGDPGTTIDTATTSKKYLELQAVLQRDRTYTVEVPPHYVTNDTATGRSVESLHFALDGEVVTDASQQMDSVRVFHPTASAYRTGGMGGTIVTTADIDPAWGSAPEREFRFLIAYYAEVGNARPLPRTAYPVQILVRDEGPATLDMGIDHTVVGGGGTPPATRRTFKSTWVATASKSYRGNNTERNPQPTDMVQGYYSANGDQHSTAIFGGTAVLGETGKTVSQALSGATIKKVEVYLYANHWWKRSGTAIIRPYNSGAFTTSPPSGPSLAVGGWGTGVAKWVDITGLATTAIRGVSLGKSGGSNLLYYGKFNGAASRSQRPLLRVTYSK